MPEAEQRQFLRTPLAGLSAAQLYSYNSAVPLAECEPQYAREIKYFLPAILQALCACEEILSLAETALQHLYLERDDCWSVAERGFIQRFATAFIAARCRGDQPFLKKQKAASIP